MPGLVVDTSALLAYFDSSEPDHGALVDILESSAGPFVVSPYVVAEVDYLVATRHGVDAELAVLNELASGAWELSGLDAADLGRIRSLIEGYRGQEIGVADASNVLLANRYGTRTIATLDRRHFEVLRTVSGEHFEILPG